MNRFIYTAYVGLASGLFLSCIAPFWMYTRISGRHRNGFRERLGLVPRGLAEYLTGSPRIWIHAASLGEINAAAAIVDVLKRLVPGCSVVVSTTTEHGKYRAIEAFGEDTPVIFGPIDFVGSVRTALSRVRPHILAFLETEVWPTWIIEAKRMGIAIALINGRISARSINTYLKFKPFFREVLKSVDAFSMIRQEDADRIKSMGADPARLQVNGNAKYDLPASLADPALEEEIRKALQIDPSATVFVAGSTRTGEEEIILDAYQRILVEFPDTILAIAPRHIRRTPEIESLVRKRGLACRLRSELAHPGAKRTEPVVIMNTFGELFKLYSTGTIVFCGGSLAPLGGQNPIEAAVWGKPVFYGPHMDDFLDARAILEGADAGVEVSSAETLAEKAIWYLGRRDALEAAGLRARDAVIKNQGAAERHARVIERLLSGNRSSR